MKNRDSFEKHIKDFFGPVKDTSTFAERIGEPEELPAVIGLISMKFSHLEDILSETIIKMLQLDKARGNIITAELSYKVKVHVFASLYYELKDNFYFNSYPDFEDEYFKELIKALNKCEELRNQVMHSTFTQEYISLNIFRKKITAKQKTGLRTTIEKTNIINLFNIADYIGGVEFELDNFGIDIMSPKNNSN